jgi:hypothetical protein
VYDSGRIRNKCLNQAGIVETNRGKFTSKHIALRWSREPPKRSGNIQNFISLRFLGKTTPPTVSDHHRAEIIKKHSD